MELTDGASTEAPGVIGNDVRLDVSSPSLYRLVQSLSKFLTANLDRTFKAIVFRANPASVVAFETIDIAILKDAICEGHLFCLFCETLD
jgi:hypothetical protein